MHSFELSPSLMTMDLDRFAEQIGFLNDRVSSYHVDIMDGHFVPNLALSPWFVSELRKVSDVPVSAHLMVTDPAQWVAELLPLQVEWICLHAEVLNGVAYRLIDQVHRAGSRFGVVLNPETPVDAVLPYLDEVDRVTLMTVDPGFAGERFVEKALAKVGQLRQLREDHGWDYLIEIDGSFNAKSFRTMVEAQADAYIIGRSGLFGLDRDISRAWERMTQQYQRAMGEPMCIVRPEVAERLLVG